jgi:hypothetical protein
MLINISYENNFFYVWGITDLILEKNNRLNIDSDIKILKVIAQKCARHKKYILGPKKIEVLLPSVDGKIDVTGKSKNYERFHVDAYLIHVSGFSFFAPTRFKKEFPKKDFINIHFSNSFILVHLLMRIASELIDSRSYYPKISQNDQSLFVHWQMFLDKQTRFYIEQLTREMPEVFFLFKDVKQSYFEFIINFLDDFVQTVQSKIQIIDEKSLKKMPPLNEMIIKNLSYEKPEKISILNNNNNYDQNEIKEAITTANSLICDDYIQFKLGVTIDKNTDANDFYDCNIGLIDKISGDFFKFDKLLQSGGIDYYTAYYFYLDLEKLNQVLSPFKLFSISDMSIVLDKIKELQIKYGVTVVLPSGMTHVAIAPQADILIEVNEDEKDISLFSPQAIANVKWNILLGDQPVTLEELQTLADEKKTHYMNGDVLIPVDPNQLHLFLKQIKKMQKQKLTPFDLLRADVGYGIHYSVSSGWLKKVFDQLKGQLPVKELEQPLKLDASLRPYQVRGYSWLTFMRQVGLGACLADDMGLGKTIQTIAYMLYVRQTQEISKKRPFLLVCPTSLLSNWQRELFTFAPSLNVVIHHGADRQKEEFEADIVITSYSLVDRDKDFLVRQVFEAVILDEAQNIKNSDTKQTQAVKALKARHRIVLTGTPIENKPADIWSIMDFINHGLLGSKTWFNSHYSKALSYSNKKEQEDDSKKVADQLKAVVGPFMLRRLKTDKTIIVDLPDKIKHRVVCSLSLEQTSLYKACVDKMLRDLEELDGLARRGLIFTILMRLKQICNHPGLVTKTGEGESGKLEVLYDILEDILEANEKVLIFTQFKEMGDLLVKRLEKKFGKCILFLNGSTPAKERGNMVKNFQEDEEKKIFILSLKAGGIGLNLTAANHVVHYDRWWNPAVEEQATSRAHRIGQEKIVSVHTFVCEGTIEDKIDMMIEKKIALADSVVGEGEGWITELNDRDLKDLLTLKDAK